jgi:squalene/oxidosqualene cyclase-like protein
VIAASPKTSVEAAIDRLIATQDPSGSWTGDYGGPLFLLPMFVATARVTGYPLDPDTRQGMVRYLRSHQREDGGWGLHVEGESHVFTTALSYVALRFLAVPAEEAGLAKARAFLSRHGGPLASASWGKFTLAWLGLYDWKGIRPVPPEAWLLPDAWPVHPSRLWCHSRMVYLPMSWLYARRATAPLDPLVEALRGELYGAPWNEIPWDRHRDACAPIDRYVAPKAAARAAFAATAAWERVVPSGLRDRACAKVLGIIDAEDRATDFVCLGPVNKLLNTLVRWFDNPGGTELARHHARMGDYLWHGTDGVKMQGYNSSQLWDTAFAVQAIVAAQGQDQARATLTSAHAYIRDTQVLADVPDRAKAYRDPSRGGWPFSTRAHGWPISDCTAEGLKAALALAPCVDDPIPAERLDAAAGLILDMQNDDGGWATYERTRGPRWLERLNPSECFDEIMTDISYVECTSACVQALAAYAAQAPDTRKTEFERAIERGRDFLLRAQRADGSFEGSWGICFTYGTWFGVTGLKAAGLPHGHDSIQSAARFLESKQLPDGGWGETAESCRSRAYVHAESGQAVMTSWALLALVAAGRRDGDAVQRGVDFLEARQRDDGSFPPEHIAGMFNKTCAIHYDNYLKIFPLWALAVARAGASPTNGDTR